MGIKGGDQGDMQRTVAEQGKPSFPRTSATSPSLSLSLFHMVSILRCV